MEAQPNIRLLKVIVICLGVLILASLGAIVVGVAYRIAHPPTHGGQNAESDATASVPIAGVTGSAVVAATPGFGVKTLTLPAGARVLGMQLDGRHLALRVRLLGGEEQILLFDLSDGAKLGTFRLLAPAPTPATLAPPPHPPATKPPAAKPPAPSSPAPAAPKPAH